MASLFNTRISDTYVGLIKSLDNAAISTTLKQLSDGSGNSLGIYVNTSGDFKVNGILEWGSLKDTGENITITKFVDEADGISNNDNDTTIPTSAAVKDYVDTQITAEDLDFAGDTGSGSVDLDSQVLTVSGTANEIETSASGQTLTIGLPSSISVNLVGNVTGDVTGDLTGNVTATSILADGVTATTQASNDNSTKVATTAYVDAQVTAEDLDFSGDSGSGSVDLDSQTFSIIGTTNEIETSATGQQLQIGLPSTISVNVTGNVTGNLTGDVTGNITATSVLADGVTGTTQSQGDNSTKIATTSYVDSAIGNNNELSEVLANGNTTGGTDISVSTGDNITFADSTKAIFGNDSDLQIYHDNVNSYIADAGAGSLRILVDDLRIRNAANNAPVITGIDGGSVFLYHNGNEKIKTISTGIDVTGSATISSDLILSDYGSGTHTGTATQRLGVDSSGNVIEIPIGAGAVDGSGTANTVTMWSDSDTITDAPITISGNNSTFAGNIRTSGNILFDEDRIIARNTSDGSDSGTISLTGGGDASSSRGAYLQVFGNEHSSLAGQVRLVAGNVANAELRINAVSATGFITNYVGGSERMRLDSSGRLGIGLTPTTVNLEVKSIQDSSFDEGIGVVRSNSSQTGYINMVGGAMNINAPNAIPIKFRDGGNTNLTIGGDGNATFAGDVTVQGGDILNASGNFTITSASDFIVDASNNISLDADGGLIKFLDAGSEKMRLDSSGRLGLGTSSPQTYLQIGDYPSNNIDITTYPNVPSEHMIHLSAPETTNRYGAGISFGENSFTGANITVQDAGGNGSLHMLFGTRDTSGIVQERLRISSNGDVLLGKTGNNIATVGIELRENGLVTASRDAGTPLIANREGTVKGNMIDLRQDNSPTLTIGTSGDNVFIAGTTNVSDLLLRSNGLNRIRIHDYGLTSFDTYGSINQTSTDRLHHFQIFTMDCVAGGSGVAKDFVNIGSNTNITIHVYARQDSSNIGTKQCALATANGTGTVVDSIQNFVGNVTDIDVTRSGTKLRVAVTYTGTAPQVHIVIDGVCDVDMTKDSAC